MSNRINTNISAVNLTTGTGSSSTSDINSIKPNYNRHNDVEEISFEDTNNNYSITTVDAITKINTYLETERRKNASIIEEINAEIDRLQAMYEQFLIPAKEDADKLKFAANFLADIDSWQPTEEMIVSPTYELYIQEHAKEFEEFMGMTLDEYNLTIQEKNNKITYLETYDYTLRQEAKKIPYLEIEVSNEYQNYLKNISNINQSPMVPREYLNAKNNTTLDGYNLTTIDNTKYDKALQNFNYLNQEQTNMYNYLFETKGEIAALDYLLAIEDPLNQARGQEEATRFLQSIVNKNGSYDLNVETFLKTSGKGLVTGTETFFEGFENLFDFTGDGVKTENQYAQMFILQELQKSGQLDDKFLSGTFEVSTSIGNMLPTVIISTIANSATKGVKVGDKTAGEIVGNLLMGLSAAGNAKNEALISGNSKTQAYIYGVLNGASEAVLGEMMGNIPGLNDGAKFALLDILKEGGEEFIQEYIDTGLRAAILGESIEITELNSQALKSFLYGCISSGVMTGGQTVINISIGGTRYTIDNINELINLYNNHINVSENNKLNKDLTEKYVAIKKMNIDETLVYLSDGNNKYGVDQGVFTNLKENNPVAYREIKTKLIKKYGFTRRGSKQFMTIVDAIGACNYAAEINAIASYFKNIPYKFEEIFGFPLYKQNSSGQLYLNDTELLADLYYWGNLKSSEAILLMIDENGNTIFNKKAIRYDDDGEITMVMQRGGGIDKGVNEYLQSKDPSLSCDIEMFYGEKQYELLSGTDLKDKLLERMNNNEKIVMVNVAKDEPIKYLDTNNDKIYLVSGGHWVYVTNVTEQGIIVSSWGKRCFVSFENLFKNGWFDFFSVKINLE